MPNYKDFPKHDPRRVLVVLFAIEQLGKEATTHYIAQELSCTRSEVQRAIEAAARTFHVETTKDGSVYKIDSWGFVDRDRASKIFAEQANNV